MVFWPLTTPWGALGSPCSPTPSLLPCALNCDKYVLKASRVLSPKYCQIKDAAKHVFIFSQSSLPTAGHTTAGQIVLYTVIGQIVTMIFLQGMTDLLLYSPPMS